MGLQASESEEIEMAETTTPVTCVTCGQTLTEWTNHLGVTLLVANDGWGSICGEAPRGMHQTKTETQLLAEAADRARAAAAARGEYVAPLVRVPRDPWD